MEFYIHFKVSRIKFMFCQFKNRKYKYRNLNTIQGKDSSGRANCPAETAFCGFRYDSLIFCIQAVSRFQTQIRINNLYSRNTVKSRLEFGVSGTPDLTSCSQMLINAFQHGGRFIGFAILTISIPDGRKIHVQPL